MHILLVTGEYPPMQGGVGAYTSELAAALLESGSQVSIFTSNAAHTIDDTDSLRDDVPVYRQILRWTPKLYRQVLDQAHKVKADWLHIQYQTAAFGMNPSINFAPQMWKRMGFKNVAWTYHDLLVPYLFPKAGRHLRQWVTQRPAQTAQLTIVTNEDDKQQLLQSGIAAERVAIGSNIQGYALTAEERSARRAMRGYHEKDLVIAYFGFLNRSKGGITLIRTLYRLKRSRPRVKLLMIGERVGASDPTNYAYLQEVEQLAHELGVADLIQWTGYQSDADVGADLNACDVLFMPYEDGASLRRGTLMAGLANGCVIVTTEPQTPIPELEDGAQLLYVPPRDPDAAALMIAHVSDNSALAVNLRRRARRRSQHFRWDTIAARHQELYTQYDARRQSIPLV